MLKPTDLERREFAKLRNSAVHTYLVRSYTEAQDLLVSHTDADRLRVLQGQAQHARVLLELIDPDRFTTNGKRT